MKLHNLMFLILVRKKDDPNDILFSFQSTGGQNIPLAQQLNTTLPLGPDHDYFNMSILVKIIDDSGGTLNYLIPTQVSVQPNPASITKDEISKYSTTSNTNRLLFSGDLNDVSRNIIIVSQMLNRECYADRSNLGSLNES